MQIQVGAEWQAPGGGYQYYAVTFEEIDITAEVRESVTRGQAIDLLNRRADALVLTYVHTRGGISAETYRAKMQAIRDASKA
jgi:hypothetical protein